MKHFRQLRNNAVVVAALGSELVGCRHYDCYEARTCGSPSQVDGGDPSDAATGRNDASRISAEGPAGASGAGGTTATSDSGGLTATSDSGGLTAASDSGGATAAPTAGGTGGQASGGPPAAQDGSLATAAGQDASAEPSTPGDSSSPTPKSGEDAGPETSDSEAPHVLSAEPASGTANLERTAPFTVTFSQPMRLASLQAGGLRLMLGTTEAAATISLTNAGRTAVLTPSDPLVLAATYHLVVTTTAEDASGIKVGAEWPSTYQIREGRWSTPATVESTPTVGAQSPHLGIDARGNAVLGWIVQDATSSGTVRAARYNHSTGWKPPVDLSSDGSYGSAALAIGSNGQAIFLWNSSGGVTQSSFYDGTGWSSLGAIGDSTDSTTKSVAIDGTGKALALWQRSTASKQDYRARAYSPDLGWVTPTTEIDTRGTANNDHGAIVLGKAGEALVVYPGYDPADSILKLMFSHYRPGGSPPFSAVGPVPYGSSAQNIAAASDAEGNGFCVWQKNLTNMSAVYAASVNANGNWGTAAPLSDALTDAYPPAVAMGPEGTAVVAWMQLVSSNQSDGARILSRHYTPAGGWATATTLWTGATKASDWRFSPQAFLDAAGNGFVMWSPQAAADSFVRVRADRWQAPPASETIDPLGGDTATPQLAVGAQGDAMLVWGVGDTSETKVLWYRVFN